MAYTSRIAYNNLLLASGVVITSSGDFTGYTVQNLANGARWRKWRSAQGTGDQWVLFDLGANQSFQLLALTDVLLHTGGGTLKFQANATNSWGSPTVSDTITLPSPDLTHVVADWLSAAQNLRWIRFYFTNVGASNTFVEIGAAFCGPYFESAKSIAPGASITPVDPSQQRIAIGGQRSTIARAKYHQLKGTFAVQSVTDRDNWRVAFNTNGASQSCIFTLQPATASLTFYGVFQPSMQITHVVKSIDLWNVPFDFVEDVP